MSVEVHVERLILHGFPDGEGAAIAAALGERLGALIAGAAVDWAGRSHVDAGSFRVGASAQETGVRLAAAVHQGLSR